MEETTEKVIGVIRKMDPLNRVTIPREYCNYLNLHSGQKVEVVCYESHLVIKKPSKGVDNDESM